MAATHGLGRMGLMRGILLKLLVVSAAVVIGALLLRLIANAVS